MGHWAEIDENNIVKRVIVIKEAELDTGNWGDKSKWIKTSYNTFEGKHYTPSEHQDFSVESTDQSKALRFRYASAGMYYDATNDVFYNQKPFASWVLNTTTWIWEAPLVAPEYSEQYYYVWNEEKYQKDNTQGWERHTRPTEEE